MRDGGNGRGLATVTLVALGIGLVPVAGCRLAPTGESSARHEAGVDRQVTSDPAVQASPDISGDRVVWQEQRDGQSDVFLHDLATGETRRLTDDPADQIAPRISGNRVVWEDHRHAGRDVYTLDVTEGVELRLTPEASVQVDPDVSDGRVVWRDDRMGGWGVVLHDLTTGQQAWLATGSSAEAAAISETTVVWLENGRIRGRDLATGKDLEVPGDQGVVSRDGLAMDGPRVAWTKDDSLGRNVYVHDFDAALTTQVTATFGLNAMADISGTRVATIDVRGGPGSANRPLFLRHLETGQVLQANPWDVNPVREASVDGARVVYTGFRHGTWDVHLYELK